MDKIIGWLIAVQGNPKGYSLELFAQGVHIAAQRLKSKLLVERYKGMLKGGRLVPPLRKQLLYQQLLRVAKQAEGMAEKKSEPQLLPVEEAPLEAPTSEAPPEAPPTTDEAPPKAPSTGEAPKVAKKRRRKPSA
jgi:hypothetical protein